MYQPFQRQFIKNPAGGVDVAAFSLVLAPNLCHCTVEGGESPVLPSRRRWDRRRTGCCRQLRSQPQTATPTICRRAEGGEVDGVSTCVCVQYAMPGVFVESWRRGGTWRFYMCLCVQYAMPGVFFIWSLLYPLLSDWCSTGYSFSSACYVMYSENIRLAAPLS